MLGFEVPLGGLVLGAVQVAGRVDDVAAQAQAATRPMWPVRPCWPPQLLVRVPSGMSLAA